MAFSRIIICYNLCRPRHITGYNQGGSGGRINLQMWPALCGAWMVNRVLVHCCARSHNLQLISVVSGWEWKTRRALLPNANAELTFRSPLCAFSVSLSYRIRPSPEHPRQVTALISYHLKRNNRVKSTLLSLIDID